MGYWKQNIAFNLSKMGKTKNYCLHNVRLAFGIGSKYANAKLAMKENRDKGALHPLSTLPKNVAVPIYSDKGVWGHIEVSDKGVYYSDGVKVAKPYGNYWGEWINGYRIVSWVDTAKKTNEQIADEVMKGLWGNGNDRIKRLSQAGYDYNAIQAIVNKKMAKPTPAPAPKPTQIKVGDTVIVNGQGTATSKGTGGRTKSYKNQKMKVMQIYNGRYGCNQYNQKGAITGWWAASQVKKG